MSFTEYTFEFLSGKYEGGRFRFPDQSSFSIGRDANADFVLVEEMVSRFHAKIIISEESILVADAGSSNGTYLNGQKINQATPMEVGDKLLIGKSILRLSLYEKTTEHKVSQLTEQENDFEKIRQSGVTRAFSIDYLQNIVERRKKGHTIVSHREQLKMLFPDPEKSLTLKHPLTAKLNSLSAKEQQWLQQIWNAETISEFFERSNAPKEEAANALINLWNKDFLMFC